MMKRFPENNSSGIRQKGQSQNSCFKKTKHAKSSKKQAFPTPWYADERYRQIGGYKIQAVNYFP